MTRGVGARDGDDVPWMKTQCFSASPKIIPVRRRFPRGRGIFCPVRRERFRPRKRRRTNFFVPACQCAPAALPCPSGATACLSSSVSSCATKGMKHFATEDSENTENGSVFLCLLPSVFSVNSVAFPS